MGRVVEAKLRRIGTSAGVIIPKEVLEEEGLRIGETIEISVFQSRKRREEILKKAIGIAKGAGPFKRDKKDRY